MKKYVILIVCLLVSSLAFSQENHGFFYRLREHFVVHDTIYIYESPAGNDTIVTQDDDESDDEDDSEDGEEGEGGEDNDESEEFSSIPVPIDTLDTSNRYQKVVLFDNGTWLYYNIERPQIPDSLDDDHWVTEQVHSYNDVALKDLPDEVDLVLVDSVHSYCIPHPGYITSRYKFRKRRPHKGIDIGLSKGDAIYAAFDGVVRAALPTKMTGGYGNVLVIRHLNGLETYYGHLSSYIVESGDIVKAGELIGYGGSTGRSTGPHLHFETRYMGQAFDPERIFDFERGTLRSETFLLKKHYFSINSHYGMSDRESELAAQKKPVDTSSGSGSAQYYKVKKGDTLSKIARRHNTTVQKLCQLNKIKASKPLQIGQRIRVR